MLKRYQYIFILSFFLLLGFVKTGERDYYEITKSLDLFGRVFKEVVLNYSEPVNPSELVKAAINGMLNKLDPYTNFIDTDHKKDIDVITKGKYGGIGASIGLRDSSVTIIDIIEGFSAERQGLRRGDIILEIDSVKINKDNYDKLSSMVKGKPGTLLNLKILREGITDTLEFNIVREEITIKNLVYYDFYPEKSNNLYLKLTGFSRSAGNEIKNAILEKQKIKPIKSVILDLRNNPGGLLDAAVDIVEKFIGKDKLIVSVIGKDSTNIRQIISKEEPLLEDAKLAVLINNGSASASEIVAGAIQDHDRGVILGSRSFGKGLVQTIIPLPYNNVIKITSAKYFTPSGRCIQKIDYTEKNRVIKEPVHLVKSSYTTENGRIVFSKGGIEPDSSLKEKEIPLLIKDILAKGLFFNFANYYSNIGSLNKKSLFEKSKIVEEFIKYLKLKNYRYKSQTEKVLSKAIEVSKKEGLKSLIEADLKLLEKKIKKFDLNDLKKFDDEIFKIIQIDLNERLNGIKGRIEAELTNDNVLKSAFNILRNDRLYNKLLNK